MKEVTIIKNLLTSDQHEEAACHLKILQTILDQTERNTAARRKVGRVKAQIWAMEILQTILQTKICCHITTEKQSVSNNWLVTRITSASYFES